MVSPAELRVVRAGDIRQRSLHDSSESSWTRPERRSIRQIRNCAALVGDSNQRLVVGIFLQTAELDVRPKSETRLEQHPIRGGRRPRGLGHSLREALGPAVRFGRLNTTSEYETRP